MCLFDRMVTQILAGVEAAPLVPGPVQFGLRTAAHHKDSFSSNAFDIMKQCDATATGVYIAAVNLFADEVCAGLINNFRDTLQRRIFDNADNKARGLNSVWSFIAQAELHCSCPMMLTSETGVCMDNVYC